MWCARPPPSEGLLTHSGAQGGGDTVEAEVQGTLGTLVQWVSTGRHGLANGNPGKLPGDGTECLSPAKDEAEAAGATHTLPCTGIRHG